MLDGCSMKIWHALFLALVSVLLILSVIFNAASGESRDGVGESSHGASGSGMQSGTDLETSAEPPPKTLKEATLFKWGFTTGIGKVQPPEGRGAYSSVPH